VASVAVIIIIIIPIVAVIDSFAAAGLLIRQRWNRKLRNAVTTEQHRAAERQAGAAPPRLPASRQSSPAANEVAAASFTIERQ